MDRLSDYANDGAGRLISATAPDGDYLDYYTTPTTAYSYDDVGNLITSGERGSGERG